MKKLIPPVLFLLCIALMVIMRYLVVFFVIFAEPFNYFGAIAIILGISLPLKVRKQFQKMDTEIHTFEKPRKLVSDGLFKSSRNPVYLGFTISLLGVWILLGSMLPFLGCILFFLISHYYYIPIEEKIMEVTFGNDYLNYKSKVRRWL